MILHAHECRARANEARELARQVKRASTKTALEQAAEYWFALAERVEQQEGALHLPPLFASHVDGLPVFRYLVSVGIALFLGMLAVSAQFESRASNAAAVSKAQTNAALLSDKPY